MISSEMCHALTLYLFNHIDTGKQIYSFWPLVAAVFQSALLPIKFF